MLLLGKLVQARTIAREKIAAVPLEKGNEAVMLAIKLQGQISGIDLAIDTIFDIMNFNLEEEPDDDTSGIDTRRDAAELITGSYGNGSGA